MSFTQACLYLPNKNCHSKNPLAFISQGQCGKSNTEIWVYYLRNYYFGK